MARIDQAEIDRIKRETEIVQLIQGYGTKLKDRDGEELIGLCPIHDDKNPSLCVNRKKNEWICHGACKAKGDVISWVMHAEKCSFPKAVQMLQEGATGQVKQYGEKSMKLESPFTIEQTDQELLKTVVDFYSARLKQCPNGLAYLEKRGLVHPELIDTFQIGFVDRTLGYRLPPTQIKAGEEIRERLKELGVLRKKTGHEHLRGCIVFPLYDFDGNIVQMYGRRIDNGGKGDNPHFYMERPRGGIFNAPALKLYDELILCESIIDALTFWVAGYRNVTASFGVNGFTDEMLDAIQNSNVKRILIAYDNDEAGNGAADELAKKLNAVGIDAFRIKFPSGQDANEYASKLQMGLDKGQPGHASLGLAIRNAEWLGNGKAEPTITTITPNFLKEARDAIAREQAAEAANVERLSSTVSEPKAAVKKENQAPKKETANISEANKTATPQVSSLVPQASPLPPVANATVEAEIKDNEITIPIGNRTYRVRGLEKNGAYDVLKVNVLVRKAECFFIDTLDMYAARSRNQFIKEAAKELLIDEETIKRDLGKVLLKLEELQETAIADAQAIKQVQFEITDAEKAAAMELLKSENLLDKILDDFEGCGVVGERNNKLVGYLAATSRKLERPLAIMVQSCSAAGKSSLMEAILRFLPSEEQVTYSAMTGQSLFYMGGMNLQHKVLAIAEEEGIRQASYALKLLQSEGQLTIASTGKDPGTGRMETQEYHVEGPVMIFLTTTALDVDEELLNRCLVLTVDEDREQTRAILAKQRMSRKAAGLRASAQRASIVKLHQNAQRLLRPLAVVNDYADQLSFLDDQTRRRRDHMKYLTLIESVALLHQYQRPVHTLEVDGQSIQYIEVTPRDIAIANTLAEAVLGRSIDELPPQTRRLLRDLFEWVRRECEANAVEQVEFRFSRRRLREALGWSQTALKRHLERLLEMEYIIGHRVGARATEYELLYDGRGREGQPTLCGLIDPSKLQPVTTTTVPIEPSSTHPNGGSSRGEPSSSPQEHTDIRGSSNNETATSPIEMLGERKATQPTTTSTNTEAA
jgi:DNA primase catalytic core